MNRRLQSKVSGCLDTFKITNISISRAWLSATFLVMFLGSLLSTSSGSFRAFVTHVVRSVLCWPVMHKCIAVHSASNAIFFYHPIASHPAYRVPPTLGVPSHVLSRRLGSVWFGSVWLGPARLGSVRLVSACLGRLRSTRFGSARPRQSRPD